MTIDIHINIKLSRRVIRRLIDFVDDSSQMYHSQYLGQDCKAT